MPKVLVMPKKKEEEPETTSEKRKTSPVQVSEDLARWSVIIATQKKIKVSELLEPVLRPYLSELIKAVGKQIQNEADEED